MRRFREGCPVIDELGLVVSETLMSRTKRGRGGSANRTTAWCEVDDRVGYGCTGMIAFPVVAEETGCDSNRWLGIYTVTHRSRCQHSPSPATPFRRKHSPFKTQKTARLKKNRRLSVRVIDGAKTYVAETTHHKCHDCLKPVTTRSQLEG